MKFKPDFVVLIHRIFFEELYKKGGLDLVIDHFLAEGKVALLIEFPLNLSQGYSIFISKYSSEGKELLHRHELWFRNNFVLWFLEPFICIYYTLKYAKGVKVVMTSDPLTSFPAVILRKFNVVKKFYYHFIDYSKTRFDNKFLNEFYMEIMRFGVANANLVGCVTQRIVDILQREVKGSNCVHIPNSPDFGSFKKYRKNIEKRNKFSLVISIAEVSKKYYIKELVETVERLKKDFPQVVLRVVGDTLANPEYFKELQRYITRNELKENIIFTGFISKTDNLNYVANSYIALAFYDSNYSHVNYGDSLKIREAVALGIPVVADSITSTAEEMQEFDAGIMIEDVDSLYKALKNLFEDEKLYRRLTENALEWAERLDKKIIISKYLDFF